MRGNIYFVQANAVYGDSVKSAYLPYASGCLVSYAFADEKIRSEYSFGRFVFLREDIDSAIASFEEPAVVGFSSYVWNMEYNRLFARRLREKYPSCLILFGGHSVCPGDKTLREIPEADIVMHGEGEESFRKILLSVIDGTPLSRVANISYRDGDLLITTHYEAPGDISAYPSPYLEGWFDGLAEQSGIIPSVIWETNRGCPNRCAFCDWGALKSKIRHFPEERTDAELMWMVRNHIEYVYCADANFGLFPRDTVTADKIIGLNKKYGYPKVFKTNYTKNRDDVVFEISSKLINAGIGKSPTLSFQSLSPVTLECIGRSNMELSHFRSLMDRYGEAHVPVYSELILALPGETYDSFSSGISQLLECNQHTAIGIYPCELLPNSLMGSEEYIGKYGIKTVSVPFSQYHCVPREEQAPEKSSVIISTSAMSTADWEKSFIFSITVQAFHNLGLTRFIAMRLNDTGEADYRTFYEKLIEYFSSRPGSVTGKAFESLRDFTHRITLGEMTFSVPFGKKTPITWPFEEYLYLRLLDSFGEFSDELSEFVKTCFTPGEETDELLSYQRRVIKQPGRKTATLQCAFSFYDYFEGICSGRPHALEKKSNTLVSEGESDEDFDTFAAVSVWYGRRDDAQLYVGGRNRVTIK